MNDRLVLAQKNGLFLVDAGIGSKGAAGDLQLHSKLAPGSR